MKDQEEKSNYDQMGQIIAEGTQVLHLVFKCRYKKLCKNSEWEDTKECRTNFISTLAKDIYSELKPIQKKLLEERNLHEWDLGFVAFLLTKIDFSLSSPSNGRERSQIKNENFKIHQLRHVRNDYAHPRSPGRISNPDFLQLKGKAESSIRFLRNHYKMPDQNLKNAPQPVQTHGKKKKRKSGTGGSNSNNTHQIPIQSVNGIPLPVAREIPQNAGKFHTATMQQQQQQSKKKERDKQRESASWTVEVDELNELIEINEEYLKSEDFPLVGRGCVFFAQQSLRAMTETVMKRDDAIDTETVIEYLETAADAGNRVGLYNLGVLYHEGRIVGRDYGRAFELFEEAAKVEMVPEPPFGVRCLGAAEAQYALAKCYSRGLGVKKNDLAAELCFNLAVIWDNSYSLHVDKIRLKDDPNSLDEESDNLADLGTIPRHFLKASLPLILDFENPMPYIHHDPCDTALPTQKESRSIWSLEKVIRSHHKTTPNSLTFASILSNWMSHFALGLSALTELQEFDSKNLVGPLGRWLLTQEILHHFANSFKTTLFKQCLSSSNEKLLFQIIQESFTFAPSIADRNARICKISSFVEHHNSSNLEEFLQFILESKSKYPLEPFFHIPLISLLESSGRLVEALQVTQDSCRKFPRDYEILYRKAKLLFCQWTEDVGRAGDLNQVADAYHAFLKMAPRDHWLLPETYYVLSYLTVSQKLCLRGLQYYRRGLDMEKGLLDCFRPFESVAKMGVEGIRREILYCDTRAVSVWSYRRDFKKTVSILRGHGPLRVDLQKEPLPLESICKTKWTIVEDILFGVCDPIRALVCDDKWNFGWAYFYGVNQADEKWRKVFCFGTVLLVQPDLMVLSEENGDQCGFGVSFPEKLKVVKIGLDEAICRFCGLREPKIVCGGCQRASYCGRECQEEDWEVLKHGLICDEEFNGEN